MPQQSILITGVHGLVGSCVYRHLIDKSDLYDVYGLDRSYQRSERVHTSEVADIPGSHFVLADLSEKSVLEEAFHGKDIIIHLAGDPNADATWESILKNNIEASYNLFETSKQAGVRRVIYASSIHSSFGYFHNIEPYKSIKTGDFEQVPKTIDCIGISNPTWPVNLYGSSKVFGETLARMYSSTTDMSCICIRMGGVHSMDEVPNPILPNACTRSDMTRLIECCIQAPDTLDFEIVYGLSNSDYRWVDLEHTQRAVGYTPHDTIKLED